MRLGLGAGGAPAGCLLARVLACACPAPMCSRHARACRAGSRRGSARRHARHAAACLGTPLATPRWRAPLLAAARLLAAMHELAGNPPTPADVLHHPHRWASPSSPWSSIRPSATSTKSRFARAPCACLADAAAAAACFACPVPCPHMLPPRRADPATRLTPRLDPHARAPPPACRRASRTTSACTRRSWRSSTCTARARRPSRRSTTRCARTAWGRSTPLAALPGTPWTAGAPRIAHPHHPPCPQWGLIPLL